MMSTKSVETWKKQNLGLMFLILEMTADSNKLWDLYNVLV